MTLRVMPDKNKKVVSNRDCLGRRKGWWLDKGGLVDQKVSWIFCVLDRSRLPLELAESYSASSHVIHQLPPHKFLP
jgi:hypothetical protein